MEKIDSVPETLVYTLRPTNSVVRVSAGFDKNPVGTYDYTVLELAVTPLLNFPVPIQHIMLTFSDETLNKVGRLFHRVDHLPWGGRQVVGGV